MRNGGRTLTSANSSAVGVGAGPLRVGTSCDCGSGSNGSKFDPALAGIHSHISPSAHPGIVCMPTSCAVPVGCRPARSALACSSPGVTERIHNTAALSTMIPAKAAGKIFLESIPARLRVIGSPSRRSRRNAAPRRSDNYIYYNGRFVAPHPPFWPRPDFAKVAPQTVSSRDETTYRCRFGPEPRAQASGGFFCHR